MRKNIKAKAIAVPCTTSADYVAHIIEAVLAAMVGIVIFTNWMS